MRHQKTGKKFSRKIGVRKALLRSLMSNLILKEKITTTETKAKETRRLIEKLVTKAKVDTVANRKFGNRSASTYVWMGASGVHFLIWINSRRGCRHLDTSVAAPRSTLPDGNMNENDPESMIHKAAG